MFDNSAEKYHLLLPSRQHLFSVNHIVFLKSLRNYVFLIDNTFISTYSYKVQKYSIKSILLTPIPLLTSCHPGRQPVLFSTFQRDSVCIQAPTLYIHFFHLFLPQSIIYLNTLFCTFFPTFVTIQLKVCFPCQYIRLGGIPLYGCAIIYKTSPLLIDIYFQFSVSTNSTQLNNLFCTLFCF